MMIGPVICLLITLFFELNIVGVGSISSMALTWNAALNPLTTIVLVKPFRTAIKKMFFHNRTLDVNATY